MKEPWTKDLYFDQNYEGNNYTALLPSNSSSLEEMLFNLDDDPGETVNLAEKKPEIVAKLRARVLEYQKNIIEVDRKLLRSSGRPKNGVWASGWCSKKTKIKRK